MRRPLTLALLVALVSSLLVTAAPAGAQTADPKVLVFSKTAGFRHSSIATGIAAIQSLGAANGFAVDATEDATQFNAAKLAEYEAVVFLSTTGDVLDAAQQTAFEDFIQAGGGYAGVHAAADTEYDWGWYGDLVGAYFNSHPANQTATVDVEDAEHPSTACVPAEWARFDEWYNYRANPRPDVNVLATLDESSYSPGGGAMGADHPIAWYHEFDGGRAWYTGMGHTEASFSEPAYRAHLLGGIQYAAGLEPTGCEPEEPEEPGCAPTASDEFDGTALDEGVWNVLNRNPATLRVADGALRITTEDGDLWSAGTPVSNIVTQTAPSGDFTVTTEVTIDAAGGSRQAAIVLYTDDDNYLKLNLIGRDGARWSEFILETAGQPRFDGTLDRSENLPASFPNTFQLRLTKSGDELTGEISADGETWTTVGRPAPAAGLTDPQIGLMALTNEPDQVSEAAFDWVQIEGGTSTGGDDEFDGDELGCPWEVVDRVDENLELADGALRITTTNGDLYGSGGNDVDNIVVQRAPGGDWEATTEVTIDATGGSEQAGMIVYAGDDDYVKLGHIGRTGEKWFEFFGEHAGQPNFDSGQDRTPGLPAGFPTTFQLRLTHSGGTVTGAYSTDGTSWTTVGRQQAIGDFSAPRVGVFATTNDDSEITTAAFDWFHLEGDGGEPGEDTTAPTVRAASDGLPTSTGAFLGRAEVTITASDGGSGVDTIEYAIGDGAFQPYEGPVEVTGEGARSVRYRATDNAGNSSTPGTANVTLVDNDCEPVEPEAGYRAIYDGTVDSLAGWKMAGPGGFDLRPSDECTIDAWGGMGLLWYAAEQLESPYTIRTEWKIYSDDDNSGVFIGFPDPGDDPWHPVSNGYEIQIDPTDERVRTTGAIYSFQEPNAARDEAVNPHGEWNVMEVEVDGQHITVRINGVVVNEYTSPHPERDPATGFVGIQNDGAGRDVTYRSVQIKGADLPPADTTKPTGTAELDGPRRDDGAYTGPVAVTLAGADEAGGSGVANVEYALDGGAWTGYATPFTVSAPGYHTVQYRVTDVAGNVSDARAVAFTILAPPVEDPPGSPPPKGGS